MFNFSLRQLQFLVALDETRSFSKAAEFCMVTQPSLSLAIKELERNLGVQLVERTKRTIVMTHAGSELAARAGKIVKYAEDFQKHSTFLMNPIVREVKFGAIPTIGPFILPWLLPKLISRFPDTKFYLREEMSDQLIAGVIAGRLDVALVALPYDTSGLLEVRLKEDDYLLVLPRDRIAAARLPENKLMLLEANHCLQRHALSAFVDNRYEMDPTYEATSLNTLVAMVSEGLGKTLLPRLAVNRGIAENMNVRLEEVPDANSRTIALVLRPTDPRREFFENFAGAIVEILNGDN